MGDVGGQRPRPMGAVLEGAPKRSRGDASGGTCAAGGLWGSFAGVGGGQKRVRAGKFFARSQANLDGTSPGRSVDVADGAGNKGKRQPVGILIVPPRGEPVKVEAGRKFFQQGKPERAEELFTNSFIIVHTQFIFIRYNRIVR